MTTTADVITPRTPAVPNTVLGTILFVAVEIMFFAALMSAYTVIRAGAGMRWIPPTDVRLPIETTAINTIFLLLSGVLSILATLWFDKAPEKSRWAFTGTMVLGTIFVVIQGWEWSNLLSLGMTIGSGVFAATFFLLIGTHALHAVSAIVAMLFIWYLLKQQRCRADHMQAIMVYWLFIVGIWPVLYRLVYF